MNEKTLKIAQHFAQSHDLDIVEYLASRNGYDYYRITAERFRGKKTGMYNVLKVASDTGATIPVERLDELIWAKSQGREQSPSEPHD